MTYNSTNTSINISKNIATPATSAVASNEGVIYKSGDDLIRFTDISAIEPETISQEVEDRFYKKAFETKSLQ